MSLFRRRQLPALLVAALSLMDSHLSAVQIEKLIPFAWTNNVRIEAAFTTTDPIRDIDVLAEIRDERNVALWSGKLRDLSVPKNGNASFSQTVTNLRPKLWSPTAANLYTLKVSVQHGTNVFATKSVRFGFRSFENRDGQFFLNGHPIFLRGVAINPPGRTIPNEVGGTRGFAESYVSYLKSQHVNAIRLPEQSQVWFDVCDEQGMMLFQGNYGSILEAPAGKKGAPLDYQASLAAYKELFESYARHPSILISILSNELPTSGERGKAFHEFLTRACNDLKRWDPTRLYIGNAGYGEGREGDVKDAHRYWGWYYNTFLTYYNLRNKNLFGDQKNNQPVTFTECIGNYTGPRGDYNVFMNRQLAAQLNWTGHSSDQIRDALAYQKFMVKEATESFRRLRAQNKHLSGIMPFTVLFYNWSGISSFDQMKPKPAMEQLGVSYAPVLLSWEMWNPNVYAGTSVTAYAHIVNDDDAFRDLEHATLIVDIRNKKGTILYSEEVRVPTIRYFDTWRKKIVFELPKNLGTGDYVIMGRIKLDGKTISHNEKDLFVASTPQQRTEPGVFLFDPSGNTASALRKLHVPFQFVRDFNELPTAPAVLIIGEKSLGRAELNAASRLQQFAAFGGRVLCLQQDQERFDTKWLPEPIQFFRASANDPQYPPRGRPFTGHMYINPERPEHPVFAGLDRHRLEFWSDYSEWNQTKAGFPKIYPVTTGFRLQEAGSLGRTAILADYDRGLEGVALCEMFFGNGSFIVSGFDLVHRAGRDPMADRLFLNLVHYSASKEEHQCFPFIDSPIVWGDYRSERGLVPGSLNGLVVHTEWMVPPTNLGAKPASQEGSGWSMHPGDQFVPRGRIPAGPFSYSYATSLRDLDPQSPEGSGTVWLRVSEGKTNVLTKVGNQTGEALPLEVFIGGQSAGKVMVGANQATNISSALPNGLTEISLTYKGSKKLVLLQTAFE
jgi:beta-galactosidase